MNRLKMDYKGIAMQNLATNMKIELFVSYLLLHASLLLIPFSGVHIKSNNIMELMRIEFNWSKNGGEPEQDRS